MFKIYYKVCCGVDVHKKMLVATIATTNDENITTYQTQQFSTITNGLKNFKDWLVQNNCKDVCMESTGKYWIPIFNILEDSCKIEVVHPKYVRAISGKKTDIKDSIWISDVFKCGLIQGSFIPNRDIRQLRDLLRYRRKLVNCKNSEKNRFQNSLITSNIMISNVISDTFGKTSLSLISLALEKENIRKEDIQPLIRKNVKATIDELLESINGKIEKEQKLKMSTCLTHYNSVLDCIDTLEKEVIDKSQKYEKEISLLTTVPGINLTSAINIIAEIGTDMEQFGSAKKLCSWCGLVPQNNESAGKKKSVRISHAGNNIKPVLIQCALSTIRSSKCTYFKNRYESIKKRRGHKRAIIAIARMLMVCVYNMLNKKEEFNYKIYEELNNKTFNSNSNRNVENKIKEEDALALLKSLGYIITSSSTNK